ncbi:MAG: hypothetical protein WCY09_08080 [Candidatus Omnitrophota bacterium]
MAKRFTDVDIWEQDWYIELPPEYKLFWGYIKDRSNHAGIWKPNRIKFELLTKTKIELSKGLDLFNKDKERIIKTKTGNWFLVQFIPFQYGTTLNVSNRVHFSILSELEKENIQLTSIRPQVEVKQGVKDKDKDKEKDKAFAFKRAVKSLGLKIPKDKAGNDIEF